MSAPAEPRAARGARLMQTRAAGPVILSLFCLATALVLSVSDHLTQAPIAARMAEDMQASLNQVLPEASYDNDPTAEQIEVTDTTEGAINIFRATQGDRVTAAAFELTGYGYAGAIRVLVGLSPSGEILGVRVLSHSETPGLGDKIEAEKHDWIESFAGRSLANTAPAGWKVRRDGGEFDQFSGATITPRAVVATVHRALALAERHGASIFAMEAPSQ